MIVMIWGSFSMDIRLIFNVIFSRLMRQKFRCGYKVNFQRIYFYEHKMMMIWGSFSTDFFLMDIE